MQSSHYPLPWVLTAPWGHSTRFDLSLNLNLQETKVPVSAKQAVHLQGGTLQAALTTTMSLGLPPKPTEKIPWRKMHREKCMEKNQWMYLLQENTDLNLQTKPPTLSHPHSLPYAPSTHPPRHPPSLPGTHSPSRAPTPPSRALTHPPGHSPTLPGTHLLTTQFRNHLHRHAHIPRTTSLTRTTNM